MHLIHDNQKTLFFVSGMFAGSWIWDRSREAIFPYNHVMMADALCAIDNSVEAIAKQAGDQLMQLTGSVTLIANSLGSVVALMLARDFPEKVDQVLISGSAGFGDIALNVRLNRHNAKAVAAEVTEMVCYKADRLAADDKLKTANSFGKYLPNLIGLIRDSNRVNGEALIRSVSCPIKAIWGREDVITPLSQVTDTFSHLGVPVRVIDECGHSPMYENPVDFSIWVNQCMADIVRDSATSIHNQYVA